MSPNGWPSTRSGWWALLLGSLVMIPAVVALALALGGCATVERTPSTPWTWEQYDSKLHDAALHYIPSYPEADAVGKPAPVPKWRIAVDPGMVHYLPGEEPTWMIEGPILCR